MKQWTIIKTAVATVGGTIATALGGWDALLTILVALVAVDYITGVVVAMIEKKLSSEVGFKGLVKKVFIFALVYVAVLVSEATQLEIIRTATIMFYVANEAISILENGGKLGVPYPDFLRNMLAQLKQQSNEGKG